MKAFFIMAALIVLASFAFPFVSVSAAGSVEKPEGSLYVSETERQEIMDIIRGTGIQDFPEITSGNIVLDKGSMMNVFWIYPEEFVETGKLIVQPSNYYYVDFYMDNGEFGGVLYFSVEDGKARTVYCNYSLKYVETYLDKSLVTDPHFPLPCNYERYEGEIREIVGEVVSLENLRLIRIAGTLSVAFGVWTENDFFLIYPRVEYVDAEKNGYPLNYDRTESLYSLVRVIGEQTIARMQAWEEENAKWQAEHPGEPNPAVGGGAIRSQNGTTSSLPLIIGCSAGGAVLLGALGVVVFKSLRKRRREQSPE